MAIFDDPTLIWIDAPFPANPREYPHNLTLLETRIARLHFLSLTVYGYLCKFSNSFVRKPETPTHWMPSPKQILTENDHSASISGSFKVIYSESKNPPLKFSEIFFPNSWDFLVQILHAHYTLLSTLDYKFLFNHLQLWWSYAILSATTIMCSKRPPSAETHADVHHNFVTIGDNWTKKSHSSVHERLIGV